MLDDGHLGGMVYFSVIYTKQLMKVFDETTPAMEQMDFYRRSSFGLNADTPITIDTTAIATNKNRNTNKKKKGHLVKNVQRRTKEQPQQPTAANPNDRNLEAEPIRAEANPDRNTSKHHSQKSESTNEVTEADRLNIVLFYADDWTMNVLGKLDPSVRTPNIDKMADNGMLFVNNCVTTSVCWVSRATLMTGTYLSRHLELKPYQGNLFKTHNWNDTLFPKLKTAGYHTGLIGKWHAPTNGAELDAAFTERKLYDGQHWIDHFMGNKTKEHITEANRRHAVQFLENRPRDKHFALKVSFFATHAVDYTTPSYQPINTGSPKDAEGHDQDGFLDAAFALITNEWKYIYWPRRNYEQLFHRSLDPYDEYDILQNYYLRHQRHLKGKGNNISVTDDPLYIGGKQESWNKKNIKAYRKKWNPLPVAPKLRSGTASDPR